MTTLRETLSMIIYSGSGVGKSWLAKTAPGPRLVLDAEGGSRFVPGHKIKWNPAIEPLPDGITSDTSVLVSVTDWGIALAMYQYIHSQDHPFQSIIVDTLTELQARLVDNTVGAGKLELQHWGTIKRSTEDYIRKLRDMTIHPTKPVQAVIFVCQEMTNKDLQLVPMLSGSSQRTLPQFVDVIGYLFTPDAKNRGLVVSTSPTVSAKDRTNLFAARYANDAGPSVIPSPNIQEMLDYLNQEINK